MYIAHENQTLKEHLLGVARLSRKNAGKIGCADYGNYSGSCMIWGNTARTFRTI